MNHVQVYARFQLSQARAVMRGTVPDPREWYGERAMPQDVSRDQSLDQRNEQIRVAGLSLTWQQLLDESARLRIESGRWIDSLAEDEADELVGWVPYWDPAFQRDPDDEMILLIRRARDLPAVAGPVPVWQFVRPGDHLAEHLGQIRAWLASAQPTP